MALKHLADLGMLRQVCSSTAQPTQIVLPIPDDSHVSQSLFKPIRMVIRMVAPGL